MRTCLCLFVALAAAPMALAAAPMGLAAEPLSLPEAYRLALARSEDLAGQHEMVVQAEERLVQARAALFPTVNGVWNYTWQDPATPSTYSDQRTAKVAGTWNLFRGFKDFCAIRQAGKAVQAQDLARQWASLQLYADTAQAYWQAVAAEGDRAHLAEQLKTTRDRVADLRGRVAIGRSRPSDLATTRATAASLAAQLESSGAQAAVYRETLAFLTGGDPAVELPAMQDPGFSAGELADWLKRVGDRPDVRAAAKRAEAAKAAALAAQAGHMPSVDAGADWYADRFPKPYMNWDAGITVTLPLFAGFGTWGKAAEAESAARQAGLDAAKAGRAATQTIRSLHATLARGLAQAEALREAQALAKQAYEALRADYDNGLCTNQDVLQALAAYQDAVRSFDRARAAAFISRAQLEAAAAGVDAAAKQGSMQ